MLGICLHKFLWRLLFFKYVLLDISNICDLSKVCLSLLILEISFYFAGHYYSNVWNLYLWSLYNFYEPADIWEIFLFFKSFLVFGISLCFKKITNGWESLYIFSKLWCLRFLYILFSISLNFFDDYCTKVWEISILIRRTLAFGITLYF